VSASKLAWLCLALACGCGGESGDSFTLTVSANDEAGSPVPLPGAAVALDRADGSRTEGITGSDGAVTFEHVNGAGPFAFTVAAAGYVAISNLGATQGGPWNVTLSPFGTDPTWIDVTGVVQGKKDVDQSLVVSATVASSRFDGFGPEYSLRMTSAQASLVVCELAYGPAPTTTEGTTTTFVQWAQFAVNPAATSLLDLALPGSDPTLSGEVGEALMPMTGEGTLIVPASMKGSTGFVDVSDVPSSRSAFLGGASSVELGPDGVNLTFSAEYVLPNQQDELVTTYELDRGDAWSYATSSGPPGGNIEFLDPPSLSSPQPLYGTLPVQGGFNTLAEIVNIERDDENVVWRIFNQDASNNPSCRMPNLPSSIDPRVILGTGRVSAIPEICNADPTTGTCTQWADGTPADLVSQ
jgi:hypothetical protein